MANEQAIQEWRQKKIDIGFKPEMIDNYIEKQRQGAVQPTQPTQNYEDYNNYSQPPLNVGDFDLGTQEVAPSASLASVSILPVKAPVTQSFGARNRIERYSSGVNLGTDFAVPKGTPLRAPKGKWVVTEVFNGAREGNKRANNGSGNVIRIKNRMTGEELLFEHLSKIPYRLGQMVDGGEVIGISGNTGNSTGPHSSIVYRDSRGRLRDVRSRYKV